MASKLGRPEIYTEELALAVCEAVRCSEKGLRGTLEDDPALPELRTVQRWQQNNAHFCQMFADAKTDQLRAMAEDIIDISNDDSLDPNDKRIRIDTRKWLLAKLMWKQYGDKLDLTSGGEVMAPATHLIDARVQSIIMQAAARKARGLEGLDAKALSLLD